MRALAVLRMLWARLRHRDRLDAEMTAELGDFRDALVERHRRAGLSPEEAHRAAALDMGGTLQVQEATRDAWMLAWWDGLSHDVRTAWRSLLRSPGLSLSVAGTFALGLGGVIAILSVANALLLRPMPYRDAERLVFVRADLKEAAYPRAPLSGPELQDLRDRTTRFEAFEAVWANSATLTDTAEAQQLRLGFVSTNFFPLLGVGASVGRLFTAADEVRGSPQRTIVLSWPLWQRRYGGDPAIVGRTVMVNEQPTTVVGVLSPRFKLLLPPGSGVPDDLDAYQLFNPAFVRGPRGQQFLRVVGRMRPGITIAQARDDVSAVAAQISNEFTEYAPFGRSFDTVALADENVREIRPTLMAVLAGGIVLLLIASVNAASLLVARAAAKRPETALRSALGAGLGRLTRASMVEGLTLSIMGAALGLGLAKGAIVLLLAVRPDALDRLDGAPLDARVLVTTLALALGWGVVFGLAPLGDFFRTNLTALLTSRGERGGLHERTRRALVVVQIALSVALLVGAGLMVRSFRNVLRIDPGFRAEGVLTFRMASASPRYRTREATSALARHLEQAMAAVPGVSAVASVSHLPYDNIPNWFGPYATTEAATETPAHADYRAVSPTFFRAVDVQLLEGRGFTERDEAGGQPVAIVDDLLARRAWPGQSPIGRMVWTDPSSTGRAVVPVTVIGVVRHVRFRSLVQPLNEQVYFPLRQVFRNPVAYVVRTAGDPGTVAAQVRAAVAGVDPLLPIYDLQPLSDYVVRARAVQRFAMVLIGVFAVVAVMLASVGVYGVLAYLVLRRRREFGVRLALGATPRHITMLVMGDGARLTIIGAGLGSALAMTTAGLFESQLFEVRPIDPATYAAVLPVVSIVALIACWRPARSATLVAPLDALRAE